jgi:hypothetical protein
VNASNATLYDNLNFNPIRDIAPVAGTITPSERFQDHVPDAAIGPAPKLPKD